VAGLPGVSNRELGQADRHGTRRRVWWDRLTAGEEGHLGLALRLDVEGLDALQPGLLLRVIDLAQVEHVPFDPANSTGSRSSRRHAVASQPLSPPAGVRGSIPITVSATSAPKSAIRSNPSSWGAWPGPEEMPLLGDCRGLLVFAGLGRLVRHVPEHRRSHEGRTREGGNDDPVSW